jgi:hypothetical protein
MGNKMSNILRKAYLIKMNETLVTAIWSTGYYARLIMDDFRSEHFESIFGIALSVKTFKLEEQYEKEYKWDFIEIDMLTSRDAESRVASILAKSN